MKPLTFPGSDTYLNSKLVILFYVRMFFYCLVKYNVEKVVIYLVHFFVAMFNFLHPDPLTSQYLPDHCRAWRTTVKYVRKSFQLQVGLRFTAALILEKSLLPAQSVTKLSPLLEKLSHMKKPILERNYSLAMIVSTLSPSLVT